MNILMVTLIASSIDDDCIYYVLFNFLLANDL
jgi:hypothetical protein